MNWQTALILFAMVSPAIVVVLIAYLAWKGIQMALVGKQYKPTFVLIAFIAAVIAVGLLVVSIPVWVF